MGDVSMPFQLAVARFGDKLADARLLPLAIALALHLLSLTIRGGVWLNILRAAYPGARVERRPVLEAYALGVGVNALVPMRGGDMVRVAAARRVIPESTTPTIVATLVAETAFGLVMIVALAIAAGAAGWIPVMSLLPSFSGLGPSALLRNPLVAALVAALVLASVAGLALVGRRRALAFARELARGMRVLGSARSFVGLVALPQTFDWALRGATAYALLLAFGMHASVRAAVIVLVVDSIASSLPFTPAGLGAQQALLALALGGSSQVLAFSVGAQATFTVVNVMLGLAASLALFGHVHVRRLARAAVPAG